MRNLAITTAVLILVLMAAAVAAASPLTDHAAGKMAFEVNWTPNLGLTGVGGPEGNLGGKISNLDFGITAGLGRGWAVQYRNFSPESTTYGGFYHGLKTQEFNLLYRFDPALAAFAGWHQTSLSTSAPAGPLPTKNTWQAGLIGNTAIAPKTVLYAIVGVGGNLFTGEAGVSYAMARDLEMTVFYRYKKVEDLRLGSSPTDATVKGVGLGITYKF